MLVPSAFHPHVGGVERVTERLAHGLLERGVSVLVVTNQEPREVPSRSTLDGIEVVRLPFRVPHRSVRGVAGWLALASRVRRQMIDLAADVDVINVHCVSSQASYVRAAVRAHHVPLVVSTHGEISGDAAGAYQHDRRAMRAWRALAEGAGLVTAPSRYTLHEAEAFQGRPFLASEVICNGVDLDLFRGPRTDVHVPYVLAVGRLVHNKGFDLLVSNWHRLPDQEARLVIVGDGPERTALDRLRAASPAAGRIELRGAASPSEVAALMRGACAFALTSRREALGLVVLEAMAARTPVVASRVGGVPEIVTDGDTGLLFDAGDAEGLLDALTTVMRDPAGAVSRADRAFAAAVGYSWHAVVDAYLEAYEKLGAGR